MYLNDRDCPPCPETNCEAACGQGISCVVTLRNGCDSCPTPICNTPLPNASHGVSKGALTGAIIAVLVFVTICLAGLWTYQRRKKARSIAKAKDLEPKPEVPAPADAVLSRPDPVEKPATPTQAHVRVFSTHSDTTINLDPSDRSPTRSGETPISNPFADQQSIQSGSEHSSAHNLIPIAMLPYGSMQPAAVAAQQTNLQSRNEAVTSPLPGRPVRSPDLNLRLDASAPSSAAGTGSAYDLTHVNISGDSVINIRGPNVAESIRSNMSRGSAGSRASYLSTGTYATDLFTESPTIVTRQQGRILGLSKAQVVEVPANFGVGSSPLASSHLTPTASRLSRMTTSRSVRSPLAQPSFTPADIIEMDEQQPDPSPFSDANARQSSIRDRQSAVRDDRSVRTNGTFGSQMMGIGDDADSIASGVEASITSAKRVVVGPTSGRVLSSSSNGAASQLSVRPARFSFASEASSRADSILEAFPFVPPSPISQQSLQSFRSKAQSTSSVAPSPVEAEPPSTVNTGLDSADRRLLGISTFSHASSGLESFPFELQIDSGIDPPMSIPPGVPARASLDTLALSRDLTAFPLAYDDETETSARTGKYVAPSRKSSTTHARH